MVSQNIEYSSRCKRYIPFFGGGGGGRGRELRFFGRGEGERLRKKVGAEEKS